jgi:hypothetical protein
MRDGPTDRDEKADPPADMFGFPSRVSLALALRSVVPHRLAI